MTTNMVEAIKRTAFRFHDPAVAEAFTNRSSRPMRQVLGDDETIWVVEPADAQKLERMGFEMV